MKSQKKINNEMQWLLFYLIMVDRGKRSEYSNKELYGEINSCWFHHILPKSAYPKLRYCVENIIILTAEEHQEVENGKQIDMVEARKLDILERYEELVAETAKYVEEYLVLIYNHADKNTTFFKHK